MNPLEAITLAVKMDQALREVYIRGCQAAQIQMQRGKDGRSGEQFKEEFEAQMLHDIKAVLNKVF